jgi:PAS domain S-box-containing protein
MGTWKWYRAIAAVAAVAAAIEATVGVLAAAPGHVVMGAAVLGFALASVLASTWRKRHGDRGPAILVSGSLFGVALLVAAVFPGSPSSTLLPIVAFAFGLPSLERRGAWSLGLISIAFAGATALISVAGISVGAAGFGLISSAVAGVVIEGAIVVVVLIGQRTALSNLVTRYTAIVEQVPIGVFRSSPDGTILDANPWLAEMLGRHDAGAGLVGTRFAQHVVDEEAAAALLHPDANDRVRSDEIRMRRTDGDTFWARVRLRAIRDEAGRIRWFQGAARDSTEEHAAFARQARLAAAIEQTAESVVIADPAANILYVNPAFERSSGYARAEVLGQNPRIFQSGKHSAEMFREMWAELTAGRTWRGELVNRRKDGRTITEDTTITPVFDSTGELSTYVAVQRDVTAEREAAAAQRKMEALQAERRSVTESLARLGPLATAAATAEAITNELIALPGILGAALISFDAAGQGSLMALSGPSGLPVFVGQVLPANLATHLRAMAADGPWQEASTAPPVEAAYNGAVAGIGVRAIAYAPIHEGSDLLGVLAIGTDDADYAGELVDHLPVLNDVANAARLLLAGVWLSDRRLADARLLVSSILKDSTFTPVFQPIVDLATGRFVGFEALTRFAGGVAPQEAFAEAHRVGMGLELETATLRAALAASADLPPDTWLSLNISPAMLLAGDSLRDLLAARSRPVVLEITEHDVIGDYGAIRDAFVRHGADIRLAVDDAGAGVANFHHIVELRPDFVKIDIALIRGINADLSRQALVVGLGHFARASNRTVIAEGIETAEEAATLKALDITLGQGYRFGRPDTASAWSRPSGGRRPTTATGDENAGGGCRRRSGPRAGAAVNAEA